MYIDAHTDFLRNTMPLVRNATGVKNRSSPDDGGFAILSSVRYYTYSSVLGTLGQSKANPA